MGTRTIRLPRKMVSTACHQLIPSAIMLEASVYVGMHADMEIHKAAMSFMPHLRSSGVVGAMSRLRNAVSAPSFRKATIASLISGVESSSITGMMADLLRQGEWTQATRSPARPMHGVSVRHARKSIHSGRG